MLVDKRLPNVYGQHSLIDQSVLPFSETPGSLTVSEYADSPDWWFNLDRADGRRVRGVLYASDQVRARSEVVRIINEGILVMLNA
jgi:hypothetical protein